MISWSKKKVRCFRAFTIIEILIVLVVMAVITGLGIVQWTKAIEQSHMRDAIHQLRLIHRAEKLHYAQNGTFWLIPGDSFDLDGINAALNLDLMENGMTYTCDYVADRRADCTAVRQAPAAAFTVELDTSLDLSDTNPACDTSGGNCPI